MEMYHPPLWKYLLKGKHDTHEWTLQKKRVKEENVIADGLGIIFGSFCFCVLLLSNLLVVF